MDKKHKTNSIRYRVAVAFILFTIMQYSLFFGVIYISGALSMIYDQAYNTFNFQVISRSRMIREMLNNARSGFIPIAKQINSELNLYMPGLSEIISETDAATDQILYTSSGFLIDYLDGNKDVTGVFVILNSDNIKKPSVYIRDNSDVQSIRNANSKVFVFGPSWIAKQYKFHLHYLWQPTIDFSYVEEKEQTQFYDNPIKAASIKTISYEDTFYWSRPFKINDNEQYAITFTMPLIDSNDQVYGICGFELASDHMKLNLPYRELGNDQSVYILGDDLLTANVSEMIHNGPYFDQLFTNDTFTIKKIASVYDMSRATNNSTNLSSFLVVGDNVNIYNSTSLFADETWRFYGLKLESEVTSNADTLVNMILITQLIVLAISIIYIIVILGRLSKPIEKLSMIVSKIDPEGTINLPKTYITEIDNLTNAVELLGREVAVSSSRLSTIIDMVGISVGGYEERINEQTVFITESLVKMLELPRTTKRLDCAEWRVILDSIKVRCIEGHDDVYEIDRNDGGKCWLRIKEINEDTRTIGFVMDVSDEIKELQRIEYERDHDSLTKILNRKAFVEAVQNMLNINQKKIGALIMIDLDNLKHVNENYGHVCGDSYIITMATALKEFENHGAIVSRMAGDEFTVFIMGNDKAFLRSVIIKQLDIAKRNHIQMPDGKEQRLRFSAGIAWYPHDATEVSDLVKYSDFAMFEAKHTIKGTVGDFDSKIYNGKAFLRDKLDSLDKLIEGDYANFAFQPIVDLATGEIFGYEALLRSTIESLRNPIEILTLAKSQSKLYYIENLCLNKLGEYVSNNTDVFKSRKIFFNSITSVVLKDEDLMTIINNYALFFKFIVIELTENEDVPYTLLKEKIDILKKLEFQVAIDDYGSGYNSEIILSETSPDYVKIDMSLIRDIDIDQNKKVLTGNIISYCKSRNIKVIAEGIETYDELSCMISLGANYSQGYYTGKPGSITDGINERIKSQIKDLHKKYNGSS